MFYMIASALINTLNIDIISLFYDNYFILMTSGDTGNDLGNEASSSGGNNGVGPNNPQPDNSSFSSSNSNESNSDRDTEDAYESDDSSATMTQESYSRDLRELEDRELYEETVSNITELASEFIEAYENLNDQERQEVEQRVREFVDKLPEIKNK